MRLSRWAREAAASLVLTIKEPCRAITVETAPGTQNLAVHVSLAEFSAG